MKASWLKWQFISTTLLCWSLSADVPLAIMGGKEGADSPIAYLVSPSAKLTPLSSIQSNSTVISVAINSTGAGLVAAADLSLSPVPLAYRLSPSGALTQLSLPFSNGYILATSVNSSGLGIIGGYEVTNQGQAYYVSSAGDPTSLSGLPNASISKVAINDSGMAVLGGQALYGGNPAIAYLATLPANLIPLTLSPVNGAISSVAINASGAAILGGQEFIGAEPATAYLVSPSGSVTNLTSGLPTGGQTNSVAINSAGSGIVVGYSSDGSGNYLPFAYSVSDQGELTAITPLPPHGMMNSVAMNAAGTALIGGVNTANLSAFVPVAYLVSPQGVLNPLSPLASGGFISSVAINEYGAGIMIGKDATESPIAYLVSSSGILTPLGPFPADVLLVTTAIASLSQIPTAGLSGNNLKLANYINQYDPSSAFYFFPSMLDGTLSKALESAAPTRNAFTVITASNNLFYLNSALSKQSQTTRLFRREANASSQPISYDNDLSRNSDVLLVSNSDNITWSSKQQAAPQQKSKPCQVWGNILGAFAEQKAEQQTPAFEPVTGALLLGFDAKVGTQARVGLGTAYAYTHIHEKENAGHANLNQEYLFLYAEWSNFSWYIDAALWGGLSQADNVRHLHMTGFDFTSKSSPKAAQLAPHFEFGYDFNSKSRKAAFEPFMMLDWVQNWQRSYHESGSGPLNMGQKKQTSSVLRSEAGVRFYETVSFENWRLGFKEKLSYVNKKPFGVGTVKAFIVGAPGSFTVETFTTTQNLGVAELELLFEPNNPNYPLGTIGYQGEFGSKYQSHIASLSLNWSF